MNESLPVIIALVIVAGIVLMAVAESKIYKTLLVETNEQQSSVFWVGNHHTRKRWKRVNVAGLVIFWTGIGVLVGVAFSYLDK